MKRLAILCSFIFLAACGEQPLSPAGDLDMPVAMDEVEEEAVLEVNLNYTQPWFSVRLNPCNGEYVSFQGTVHRIFKLWDDGHYLSMWKNHASGIDRFGTEYLYSEQEFEQKASWNWPHTYNRSVRVVTNGSESNWLLKKSYTVNGNGELVNKQESSECIG